jgi:Zn-dependent protease with chaperone function
VTTVAGPSTESLEEAKAVRDNRRRAAFLCLTPGLVAGVVVGIIVAAAGLLVIGVVALVVVALAVTLWGWHRAPGVVIRGLDARPSAGDDHPRLHNLVDGLCATMGLPRPAIWVVDSPVPNALSVGLDPARASLVVTSGLEDALTLVELEGVLAHELVHIKRQDTVVAGAAVASTAPLASLRGTVWGAERVHRLVGLGREFAADQRAAAVVRYPPGIGSALDTMVAGPSPEAAWPPGPGRVAALTRWLWIDPMAGASDDESPEGNLDDTRVRAAAQSLR